MLALLIAVVLLVAAMEKLLDLGHWRAALARYPFGFLRHPAVTYGVPFMELSLAGALAVQWQPVAGVLAAALFAGFALLLGISYRKGARHECGCWGRRVSSRVGPAAVARALSLAVVSAATVPSGSGPAWYVAVTAVVVLALCWLIGQELIHATRRTRVAPS